MPTHPKELVMMVAKDLTLKLIETVNIKIKPSPDPKILFEGVGDMFQVMVTKVSQALTSLG